MAPPRPTARLALLAVGFALERVRAGGGRPSRFARLGSLLALLRPRVSFSVSVVRLCRKRHKEKKENKKR